MPPRVKARASSSIATAVLLRAFTTPDGRWRLPVAAKDVDPRFIAMLIAYEDRRFYSHHGVDFLSLGRAALQWISHGHIVSGGSTLTMQVARLIEPQAGKSVAAKFEQILRAVEIERRTDKTGVLDLYLALAPYGGNIEGLRAASLAYFGREPTAALGRRGGIAGCLAASAGNPAAGSLSGCRAGCPRCRPRPGLCTGHDN